MHLGVTTADVHVGALCPPMDDDQAIVERPTGIGSFITDFDSSRALGVHSTSTPVRPVLVHESQAIVSPRAQSVHSTHSPVQQLVHTSKSVVSSRAQCVHSAHSPARSVSVHSSQAKGSFFRESEFVTPKVKSQACKSSNNLSKFSVGDNCTPLKATASTPKEKVTAANISVHSVVHSDLEVKKSFVTPRILPSKEKPLKVQVTVSTQTPTMSKPHLSMQIGPSASFQPTEKHGRPTLSWTPIELFEFPSVSKVDQSSLAKPSVFQVHQSTDCGIMVADQGTSPAVSSPSPEAPAKAETQGPSVSSSPGLPGSSKETATRGSSSRSVSSSHPGEHLDGDSDDDSETESVVLADPEDPATELLSASESYALLKAKIVGKYTHVKSETKIVERSSFQSAFEKEKPQASSLRMTPSVKLRLAAMDEELATKKASSSSVTVFNPFLKSRDARYYLTDLTADFEAQTSILASMAGVLDQTRVKRIKKTKVAFKLTELDSIFKSAFRALEIWSYASSSFEVLGDCFLDLRDKLPQESKDLAIQYASLLRCIDKAGRHGIGETVNIVTNLMLKKREHIMSLSNASVPLSTKIDFIFAPVSSGKLLPPDVIKSATAQFRQQTETSALVAVAAASKASTSKLSIKSTEFGKFISSPLQDRRYRGGKARGSGKSSRKFFLRNRDFFSKRDRYVRGKGQGKRTQSAPANTNQ